MARQDIDHVYVSSKRLEEIVINALEWAINKGDDQITNSLIVGMGITSDELDAIGYEKENFPEMHETAGE